MCAATTTTRPQRTRTGTRASPMAGSTSMARWHRECGATLAGLEGCLRYHPMPRPVLAERAGLAHAGSPSHMFSAPAGYLCRARAAVWHPQWPDLAHTGFSAFNWVIDTYQPRLFLHGHQHRNYNPTQAGETVIGPHIGGECASVSHFELDRDSRVPRKVCGLDQCVRICARFSALSSLDSQRRRKAAVDGRPAAIYVIHRAGHKARRIRS